MKKKIVYWAPWFPPHEMHHWNILFLEPKKLLNKSVEETKHLNDERLEGMLRCPAFSNLSKNTFYIENPLSTEFNIMNNKINFTGEHSYTCRLSKNGNTFTYGLAYIFFCEDDLDMMMTSPYFSKTKHTQYARLIPGRFNISKWFRPLNMEMLFDMNKNYFKMEEYEHISYFTFLTDDKIELKRFDLNDTLRKISETCSNVSDWWKNVPLINRYERFLKTKTNKLVIKEIKKQLVD